MDSLLPSSTLGLGTSDAGTISGSFIGGGGTVVPGDLLTRPLETAKDDDRSTTGS